MIVKCPKCLQEIKVEETGNYVCPLCNESFLVDESMIDSTSDQTTLKIPFEDQENFGFFVSFFMTFKEVIFSPAKFFSYKFSDRAGDRPLLFGIISFTFGYLVSLLYNLIYGTKLAAFIETFGFEAYDFEKYFRVGVASFYIILIVVMPFLSILVIYLFSSIFHFFLYLFNQNIKNFTVTRNIICYGLGSVSLIRIIPIFGDFLVYFYGIYLVIIGCQRVHKISKAMASASVLLPLFFLGIIPIILLLTLIKVFSYIV